MPLATVNGHVLLPHYPDWPRNVQRARVWQTGVDRALTGFQSRLALRPGPRERLSFRVESRDADDLTLLLGRVNAALKAGLACVPSWGRGIPLVAASGVTHPAYRGQCYAVFNDWLLGENRAQVPNLEFELSRIPAVDWLGTAAALNGEVNPVAALAELFTDSRFGAGLPVTLLDADGWDAVASQLATDEFSVTVFLDTAKRLDALLNDFLEYLDAALFHTPDGKLSLRLLRDPVGPVTIDTDALLEAPDLTAHGWTETVNAVVVRFRNRDRGWQTDALTWRNPAAYAVTSRPLTQAIECDWITDPAVAWKVAMAYGKSRSLPWLDGRLRVRRGVGADLRPGDTVSLTYAHSGIDAVRFRVLAVEAPGPDSAEVLLTVREDTTHLVVDDYPVPVDEALAAVQYSPLPCHDVLVFEPPFAWTADANPAAARATGSRGAVVERVHPLVGTGHGKLHHCRHRPSVRASGHAERRSRCHGVSVPRRRSRRGVQQPR